MFTPIRDGRGVPRQECTCDSCGRVEVVAANHGKDGADGAGRAATKIQKMGWSYIGKRLRCPTCEAARKVKDVKVKDDKTVKTEPPVPTRAQKRSIMDLLEDVYDVESECYCQGDTDETVAGVLGLPPAWIEQLREEFFGPTGANEDMQKLSVDVLKLLRASETQRRDAVAHLVKLDVTIADAKSLLDRLKAVEKAVGPRLLGKAVS